VAFIVISVWLEDSSGRQDVRARIRSYGLTPERECTAAAASIPSIMRIVRAGLETFAGGVPGPPSAPSSP
jgi:hypothetical protein